MYTVCLRHAQAVSSQSQEGGRGLMLTASSPPPPCCLRRAGRKQVIIQPESHQRMKNESYKNTNIRNQTSAWRGWTNKKTVAQTKLLCLLWSVQGWRHVYCAAGTATGKQCEWLNCKTDLKMIHLLLRIQIVVRAPLFSVCWYPVELYMSGSGEPRAKASNNLLTSEISAVKIKHKHKL